MTKHRHVAAAAIVAVLAATMTPAAAQDGPPEQDNETIIVTGHGWGHGRGMSQYGAAGYAVNFGWSSAQILDHYYGGTVAGTAPNELLTVRIDSANGLATTVAVDEGSIVLFDDAETVTHVGTGGALRLTATTDGFVIADGPNCSGPFTDRPGVIAAEQLRISTAGVPRPLPVAPVGAGSVVVGDWDGDGDDDLGTVEGNHWHLWVDGPVTADDEPDFHFDFGSESGVPVVGDWDGDGVDSPGWFDQGTWTLRAGLGDESESTTFGYGGDPVDIPVVGDWDGDGDDDHGVRRDRRWLLRSEDGAGPASIELNYGRATDLPVVGDWNADGIADMGFVRGTTWQRRIGFSGTVTTLDPVVHGGAGFTPLVGDWDGDGTSDFATAIAGQVDRRAPMAVATPRLDPNVRLRHAIQRCVSASEQRYYRGELRAVANSGSQRTVNAVPVESYLRAVVPLEMPASWANLGDGAGAAAVQAQAVSARSYSLAEDRTSYARTCDTISCQVYGGRAVRRNGVLSSNEHPLTDQAIVATAGVVRTRDGEVARTEFSSSTGGWTAGGVFPAVEDLGDAIDINPNHDWAVVLPVAAVEARFSDRDLTKLEVTERNGLGQDGGRVFEVRLTFGDEVFTMTGNEFRRAFSLKSDWFTVDWERNDRRTDCICPEWPDHGLDSWFEDPPVDPDEGI